ncbi:MAG: FAD-dependent oxidoreductase [bacterium]|nr:FAD-dependent oxidoreductase [bacterium]
MQKHADTISACGLAFYAATGRNVLPELLKALGTMSHRGVESKSDPLAGTGAGIITAFDPHYYTAKNAQLRTALRHNVDPHYGTGIVFFPRNRKAQEAAMEIIRKEVHAFFSDQAEVVIFRKVPVNQQFMASQMQNTSGVPVQLFIAQKLGEQGPQLSRAEFERKLGLLTSRLNHRADQPFKVCSLSTVYIVYKGLIKGGNLADYYPDLNHMESSVAGGHERYPTTKKPTPQAAQPTEHLSETNGQITNEDALANARFQLETALRELGIQFQELGQSDSSQFSEYATLATAAIQSHHPWFTIAHFYDLVMHPEPNPDDDSPMGIMRHWFARQKLQIEDPQTITQFFVEFDSESEEPIMKLLIIRDPNQQRPLAAYTKDGLLCGGSEHGIFHSAKGAKQMANSIQVFEVRPSGIMPVDITYPPEFLVKVQGELAKKVVTQAQLCEQVGPASAARQHGAPLAPEYVFGGPGHLTDAKQLAQAYAEQGPKLVASLGRKMPANNAKISRPDYNACDASNQTNVQIVAPPVDPREARHDALKTFVGRPHTTQGFLDVEEGIILNSPVLTPDTIEALSQSECVHLISIIQDGTDYNYDTHIRRVLDDCRNAAREGKVILLTDSGATSYSRSLQSLHIVKLVRDALNAMLKAGEITYIPKLILKTQDVLKPNDLIQVMANGASAVCPYRLWSEFEPAQYPQIKKGFETELLAAMYRFGLSCVENFVGAKSSIQLSEYPTEIEWQQFYDMFYRTTSRDWENLAQRDADGIQVAGYGPIQVIEKAAHTSALAGQLHAAQARKSDAALQAYGASVDVARGNGTRLVPPKLVVVIGDGHAALSLAEELRQKGVAVKIIGNGPYPGGFMHKAIPHTHYGTRATTTSVHAQELRKGLDGSIEMFKGTASNEMIARLRASGVPVVIATGAMQPRKMGIPGEETMINSHQLSAFYTAYMGAENPLNMQSASPIGLVGFGNATLDAATYMAAVVEAIRHPEKAQFVPNYSEIPEPVLSEMKGAKHQTVQLFKRGEPESISTTPDELQEWAITMAKLGIEVTVSMPDLSIPLAEKIIRLYDTATRSRAGLTDAIRTKVKNLALLLLCQKSLPADQLERHAETFMDIMRDGNAAAAVQAWYQEIEGLKPRPQAEFSPTMNVQIMFGFQPTNCQIAGGPTGDRQVTFENGYTLNCSSIITTIGQIRLKLTEDQFNQTGVSTTDSGLFAAGFYLENGQGNLTSVAEHVVLLADQINAYCDTKKQSPLAGNRAFLATLAALEGPDQLRSDITRNGSQY